MGKLSLASIDADGSNGLNDMMLLKVQENELLATISLKKFRQSVSLHNEHFKNGKSYIDLKNIMSTSKIEIEKMVNIAKRFNLDEDKFMQYYKSMAPASWSKVSQTINAPKAKRNQTSFAALIKRFRKELRENTEPPVTEAKQDVLRHFASLRGYIDRFIPKKLTTKSEELKYYDCCFCGKEAPEAGHRLKSDAYVQGMQYPLCDLCRAAGTPIDYQKVAKIYYILYCESEDALIQCNYPTE